MTIKAVVRPATHEDCNRVLTVVQQVGLLVGWSQERWHQHWQRIWQDNPVLRANPKAAEIGWVLEANGLVCGYLGNILMPYWFRGCSLLAACACLWGVLPEYRGYSLCLAQKFFSQKGPDLLVNTTANPEASTVFNLLQAVSPAPEQYDTISFWITDPQALARAMVGQKLPSILRSSVTQLAAGTINIVLLALRRFPRKPSGAYELHTISLQEADQKFDELWRAACAHRSELMCVRSLEMLRWHYADPQGVRDPAIIGCYGDDRLVGYAVIRRDDVIRLKLARLRLVDIFLAEDQPEAIDLLLWGVYKEACRRGAALVELNLLPEAIHKRLALLTRFVRQQRSGSVFLKAVNHDLAKSLGNPLSWWLTRYDGDASL